MRSFRLIFMILAVSVILCGCTRVIESPRDELVQFRWYTESENGNVLFLSFSGDGSASFDVKNDADKLTLSGLCTLYNDRFVIRDDRTEYFYSFEYSLHGDCVEITYDGGTLTLDKVNDS